MLIESYDLEVFSPPCKPGAERYAAKARFAVDISPVLPYLNTTLPGAVYYPAAQALTWKGPGHNVAFHAQEIAVNNLEDRDQAARELEAVVARVNDTWARRDALVSSHETHRPPSAMAVYKLLPRTNCKRCGESSCFPFATKLTTGEKDLDDCPLLAEPEWVGTRGELEALLDSY